MELVGAGFGEDLNPAVDGIGVPLRRVGILVDADLADGVARGDGAVGEAVDVDVGSWSAGESLKLLQELGGVPVGACRCLCRRG